jgi:hypothetical protein
MQGVRFRTLRVSARADGRILRVVLTIADLDAAKSGEAKRLGRGDSVPDPRPLVLGVATWAKRVG